MIFTRFGGAAPVPPAAPAAGGAPAPGDAGPSGFCERSTRPSLMDMKLPLFSFGFVSHPPGTSEPGSAAAAPTRGCSGRPCGSLSLSLLFQGRRGREGGDMEANPADSRYIQAWRGLFPLRAPLAPFCRPRRSCTERRRSPGRRLRSRPHACRMKFLNRGGVYQWRGEDGKKANKCELSNVYAASVMSK